MIVTATPTTLFTLGKQILPNNQRDFIEILRLCANINKKLPLIKFVMNKGILCIQKS